MLRIAFSLMEQLQQSDMNHIFIPQFELQSMREEK